LDVTVHINQQSRTFHLLLLWTGRCHQRTQRSVVEIIQTNLSYDSQTELLQYTDCQRV